MKNNCKTMSSGKSAGKGKPLDKAAKMKAPKAVGPAPKKMAAKPRGGKK